MDFPNIKRVQVEGLVLLKMIKHYEEEALLSNNFVNGILLGLAQGNQLEVTNCFFLPKVQDDDPDAIEISGNFEAAMLRNVRQVCLYLLTSFLGIH